MNESHSNSTEFDYDEIERLVDGHCPNDEGTGEPDERPCTHEEMAAALAEFVRWVVFGADRQGPGAGRNQSLTRILRPEVIAKRALCAAWILRPNMFDGESLAEIGRLPQVMASRKSLADAVADFEATFGVRSRSLRTQSNRDQLSEAARKRWQRLRAEEKDAA